MVEVEERLQGLVAKLREGLDSVAWIEAVIGLGVNVARAEEVLGAYTFDLLADR